MNEEGAGVGADEESLWDGAKAGERTQTSRPQSGAFGFAAVARLGARYAGDEGDDTDSQHGSVRWDGPQQKQC